MAFKISWALGLALAFACSSPVLASDKTATKATGAKGSSEPDGPKPASERSKTSGKSTNRYSATPLTGNQYRKNRASERFRALKEAPSDESDHSGSNRKRPIFDSLMSLRSYGGAAPKKIIPRSKVSTKRATNKTKPVSKFDALDDLRTY